MKKHFMSKLSELSFADILAFLKLSQWDSKILTEVANELVQKISSLSVKMRNDLAVNLRKLEKNHYFLPNRENSIFELARINYCLGNYAEAVRLYKISIKHYGESLETLFNMGLSAYYANQKQLSCDIIKKLVKLDPKDTEAIEWLDRIEKELNL